MILGLLDTVLRTDDLDRPPARPPDHDAENAALRGLMADLAEAPGGVLQRLVEVAMDRCRGGSAGLTVEETDLWGEPVVRWWVARGAVRSFEGNVIPHGESPCGLTLDRGEPQLLERPARAFPATAAVEPAFAWLLCVPFLHEGVPVGTVWVARHGEAGPFDGEDRRALEGLTAFATLVWDAREADRRLRDRESAVRDLGAELRAERAKLLAFAEHSPAFVAMLEGPDLVYRYANAAYLKIVDHRPLIGLPVREALPELANQGWIELVEAVMETDEPYVNRAVPVVLQADPGGPLREVYVDFVLQPAHGLDGAVTGIHIHGVDVTDAVLARRALGRAEA